MNLDSADSSRGWTLGCRKSSGISPLKEFCSIVLRAQPWILFRESSKLSSFPCLKIPFSFSGGLEEFDVHKLNFTQSICQREELNRALAGCACLRFWRSWPWNWSFPFTIEAMALEHRVAHFVDKNLQICYTKSNGSALPFTITCTRVTSFSSVATYWISLTMFTLMKQQLMPVF